jgi:hypothetical protein
MWKADPAKERLLSFTFLYHKGCYYAADSDFIYEFSNIILGGFTYSALLFNPTPNHFPILYVKKHIHVSFRIFSNSHFEIFLNVIIKNDSKLWEFSITV